jgi:hypothetical protein
VNITDELPVLRSHTITWNTTTFDGFTETTSPGTVSPSPSPGGSIVPPLNNYSVTYSTGAFSYITIQFGTYPNGQYSGYDDNGNGDFSGTFTYNTSGNKVNFNLTLPLININNLTWLNNELVIS